MSDSPDSTDSPGEEPRGDGSSERDSGGSAGESDDVSTCWARVTEEVGEIVGIDGQTYTLSDGGVASIPVDNATALIERGAATWAFAPSPDAPPEPIVRDDGTVAVVAVHDDEDDPYHPPNLRTVDLGTWVCQRCGTPTTTGMTDGVLIQPHECPGCERQGPFAHQDLTDSELQVARRADQHWLPPSTVATEPLTGSFGDVWDDVRAYLFAYWDAGGDDDADAVYAGLTAFALSTWVRENLTFLSHLMLMGRFTGGKTRLLNTLRRVSYRALVSASATPASMFRLIDEYDVTFFVSEYHGLAPETRREVDAIVRAGQKRGEVVTRAEPTIDGYQPTVFDPFAHIAVASQEQVADDILNRCIRVRSSTPERDMPPEHDDDRAQSIRNRLLRARFRLLDSPEWDACEADAYDYLNGRGIDGRTREKLLAPVTVAILCDRLDSAFEGFVDLVVEQDRAAVADSEDAAFVRAVRDLAFEEIETTPRLGDGDPFAHVAVTLQDVADRFEDLTGTETTPHKMGHIRERLGFEKDPNHRPTAIRDPDLGPKLRDLCDDLGLGWGGSEDSSEDADSDAAASVETSTPTASVPQKTAVRHAREVIRELGDAADGADDAVPLADAIDALDGRVGDRDPEQLIQHGLRDGTFAQPRDGFIRLA